MFPEASQTPQQVYDRVELPLIRPESRAGEPGGVLRRDVGQGQRQELVGWVFIGTIAVLHVIQPSRGKAVVAALLGNIRPEVWVSDMLGSQRGHAVEWQVCQAHLIRDAKYATEVGDTAFSAPFRLLLLRAMGIGNRRDELKTRP